MSCFYCGGDLADKVVRFCACDAAPVFIMKRVPARVCKRCGNRSYPGAVVDAIQKIKDQQVRPIGSITVPVFDYPTIQAVQTVTSQEESQIATSGTSGAREAMLVRV